MVSFAKADSRFKPVIRVENWNPLGELSYRPDIIGVYLFGSRARGDYEKTSDVDVAILFAGHRKVGLYMHLKIIIACYTIILTHGLYIQARTLQPESKWASCLLPFIRRDGILIWKLQL